MGNSALYFERIPKKNNPHTFKPSNFVKKHCFGRDFDLSVKCKTCYEKQECEKKFKEKYGA